MLRHRTRSSILLLFTTWILLCFGHSKDYSTSSLFGGAQRVLLLTAHPDDECLFFAPTILSLVKSSITLFSLCLSVGNADGLGETREIEWGKSLQVLGIPNERSQVVNHSLLQDNFTQTWDPEVIGEVVRSYVVAQKITTILTFDDFGISQHPNHISLPKGISCLLSSPGAPSTKLFVLRTVPLLQKYLGPVAHPLTKLGFWLPGTSTNRPTYVAGISGYLTAVRAMYQHQSQLVWFRWLYILFSRYMWVNDWHEIDIPGAGQAMYIEDETEPLLRKGNVGSYPAHAELPELFMHPSRAALNVRFDGRKHGYPRPLYLYAHMGTKSAEEGS